MTANSPKLQKLSAKLEKFRSDPKRVLIRPLQQMIDKIRGFSYEFDKNGERDLLEKLSKLKLQIVFDVGSNVGDWTITALKFFPQAKVHCFELSARTFDTLRKNLDGKGVALNNLGLSSESGTIEYKDYGENSTVNTLLTNATYHDHRIKPTIVSGKVVTGSEYCQQHHVNKIDFLKIDVEGAEHLVLMGFSSLLAKKAIRVIQFEYGYTNGDAKFLMRDFYALFDQYGYVVGRVEQGGVRIQPWSYSLNDFKSGPNFVAVHRDDADAIQAISKRR